MTKPNTDKAKAWRLANRANKKAYDAARYIADRERMRAVIQRYRSLNQDKIHTYLIAYRVKNRIKIRNKVKAWQKDNRLYCNDYARRYCLKYPEKTKNARDKYAMTEKSRRNIARKNSRRRARIYNVITYRKPKDFNLVLKRYDYRCAYCNKNNLKLTEDHQIPISWGGHDAPWNLVPACKSCNSIKGARFWALQ